jgi:hypothetical protein
MMRGPLPSHRHTCSLCGTAAPCRCLGVERDAFVCAQCDTHYVDVFGHRLAVGRRVIFTAPSMLRTSGLRIGTIVALAPRIRVQADEGEFTIFSPKHLAIFRTTSEAESWLRRRLEDLRA